MKHSDKSTHLDTDSKLENKTLTEQTESEGATRKKTGRQNNRKKLNVDENHQTKEMNKRHRGTYP